MRERERERVGPFTLNLKKKFLFKFLHISNVFKILQCVLHVKIYIYGMNNLHISLINNYLVSLISNIVYLI